MKLHHSTMLPLSYSSIATTVLSLYRNGMEKIKVSAVWFIDDYVKLDLDLSDKFRTMCSIQADLSELCSNLRVSRIDPSSLLSQQHCLLTFCIELKFGATELGARIIWEADVGPLLPNKWTENTYILNRALKDSM